MLKLIVNLNTISLLLIYLLLLNPPEHSEHLIEFLLLDIFQIMNRVQGLLTNYLDFFLYLDDLLEHVFHVVAEKIHCLAYLLARLLIIIFNSLLRFAKQILNLLHLFKYHPLYLLYFLFVFLLRFLKLPFERYGNF